MVVYSTWFLYERLLSSKLLLGSLLHAFPQPFYPFHVYKLPQISQYALLQVRLFKGCSQDTYPVPFFNSRLDALALIADPLQTLQQPQDQRPHL